jgi:hypothetical protein
VNLTQVQCTAFRCLDVRDVSPWFYLLAAHEQIDKGNIVQDYITAATASKPDLVRLALYYCQRFITSRRIRRLAHHAVLFALRGRYGRHTYASERQARTAPQFRQHGYIKLNKLLSEEQCREMRDYLAKHTLLDSRGSRRNFTLDAIPDACKIGDYPLTAVVNCPHVMELANHQDILALVVDYLGFTPVITGLSLRWTFPSHAVPDEVQTFHRDCELGSIKLMVYLTDVDADSGPHTFAAATHLDRMPMRLKMHSDNDVQGKHVTMLGAAGTSFVIDTRGLHKGEIPRSRPRLMLGVQYSLLPCLLFRYKPVPYTGSCKLQKYVNRLVVA